MKLSRGEKIFKKTLYVVFAVAACFMVYPFWLCFILSINNGLDTLRGGIYFLPRILTFENYTHVFKFRGFFSSFFITTFRTLLGASSCVLFSTFVTYGISKKHLIGRKFIIIAVTITLFFSGGLIPTFLLYRKLGLINNFLVYILPNLFGAYSMLIYLSFFEDFPTDIEESAKIDGCNDIKIFTKMVMPLSVPIMLTMGLIQGVWHWNYFLDAVFFITKDSLNPLQMFLYNIIQNSNAATSASHLGGEIKTGIVIQSIKMSTTVIALIPIMIAYPFIKRYYIKGIMVGAIKG